MRHRIYLILPDVPAAERVTDELLLARIEVRHIHCLARRGLSLGNLPEASFLQKSDIAHGAQLGLMVGGVGGTVVGMFLVTVPLLGSAPLPLVAVLLAAAGGALFGAWVSSMIAFSTPNSRLLAFGKDFDQGHVLMMIDVPAGRVEEIQARISGRHPDAVARGEEPAIPAFP